RYHRRRTTALFPYTTLFRSNGADLTDAELKSTLKEVGAAVEEIMTEEVRQRIVNDGIRPDGRNTTTIRPLAAEVGLLPRVHGSRSEEHTSELQSRENLVCRL